VFFSSRVPPSARDSYNKDATSGILVAVMIGLIGPFAAVIAREQLKASAFEISAITMAPIAGNVFALLWANIVEGRPKMPYTIWSLAISRVALLCAALATGSLSFTAVICVFYIASSACGPAYSSLMREVYPDSDRARIMSYVRVCMMTVLIFVSAVGGPLLKVVSYRLVFPVAGLFGLASLYSFSRIRAVEAHGDPDVPLSHFMHSSCTILRDDRAFLWFCVGVFIAGSANFAVMPIFTIYQVDILGVDTRWAGVYGVVGSLTSMLGYLFWGAAIDRRDPSKVVQYNTLATCLIPLIYCVSSEAWMLVPTAVLGGAIGAGIELSYFAAVLHFSPPERTTHYQAVFSTLIGLRGIVAPFVGAALIQSGLMSMKWLFLTSAVVMILGYLVQVVGARRYPKPMHH